MYETKRWDIITPDGKITEVVHEETLPWMQDQVGGYIELVRVQWKGKLCRAYVNEDGLSKNLPTNLAASAAYRHHIVGNMLIELGKVKKNGK